MNLYNTNEIKQLIERYGFSFSKSLGQNFLTEQNVIKRIIENAGIEKSIGVLEIGPGLGTLTLELSEAASKVVTVELDKKLLPLLNETLSGRDNIVLINQDILRTDIKELARCQFSGMDAVVCANLPYNITTPVLSALIDSQCFKKITVMIQKEVAERICAKPDTAEYGAFSVYVSYYTNPKMLFDVPPGCFIPQPKVVSCVLSLTRREKPAGIESEELFFKTVRAAFAQRRKTLANALFAVFGKSISKPEIEEIIKNCGFNGKVRGEVLSIAEFAAVSNGLKQQINQ